MAESVERLTLDFGSGHDLTVCGSTEPAGILSLPLPHVHMHFLSLSLSLKISK